MTGFSGVDDLTWRELLKRDDYMCLHCNSTEYLGPHHYIARSHPEGTDDLENLLVLCWKCHRAYHDGFLKIVKIHDHYYFKLEKLLPF